MNEPKKYTAREAMHWMIDHQGEQMVLIEPVDGARLYLYKFTNLRFGGSLNGFGWAEVGSDFLSDKLSATIYVRTEYEEWQAALAAEKAQEDDKLPRVGESLADYSMRVSNFTDDTWSLPLVQQWIEANFVRREGR